MLQSAGERADSHSAIRRHTPFSHKCTALFTCQPDSLLRTHCFSQGQRSAFPTAPGAWRWCSSVRAPHAERCISTRSSRRTAHDALARASMRSAHCARVPRFSSFPCRRGHDLAMEQHVVRVRVVRACEQKRGLFRHQEPGLTHISNAHVCTIKPHTLDLAAWQR